MQALRSVGFAALKPGVSKQIGSTSMVRRLLLTPHPVSCRTGVISAKNYTLSSIHNKFSRFNKSLSADEVVCSTFPFQMFSTSNLTNSSKKGRRRSIDTNEHFKDLIEKIETEPDRYHTKEEWKSYERGLEKGNANLFQAWPGHIMKFITARNNFECGTSLYDYLKEKERGPNILVQTSYMVLCGKQGYGVKQDLIYKMYDQIKVYADVFDMVTAKNVLTALASTDRWRECFDLVDPEMSQNASLASWYTPIIGAALHHADTDAVFTCLDTLGDNSVTPEMEVFTTILQACNHTDSSIKNKRQIVMKLLDVTRMYNWTLTETVVKHVKEWFEGDPGENWMGRFSTVSRQGVCKSCKRELEKLSLSSDQFQLLQQKLLDKSIIGKDVFLKTSPRELSLFHEFMERTGPYDMVLDSLNIGYKMFQRSSNRERAEQVLSVVEHFAVDQKMRVLVLGKKHQHRWHRPTMNRIEELATCFFTSNMSEDDPFFIYACLYSGNHCSFVSNDEFRDMRFELGPRLAEVFMLWQQSHQLVFERLTKNGRPIFIMPQTHHTVVQSTETTRHIPYEDGQPRASYLPPSSWLCLTNSSHSGH